MGGLNSQLGALEQCEQHFLLKELLLQVIWQSTYVLLITSLLLL